MGDDVLCVTPGQRVGPINEFEGGPGTYQRGNYIYSSLVGYKRVLHLDQDDSSDQEVCDPI